MQYLIIIVIIKGGIVPRSENHLRVRALVGPRAPVHLAHRGLLKVREKAAHAISETVLIMY